MGMPFTTTVLGTGAAYFIPDWTQTPFQVGLSVITNTSGVNGTCTVDVTFSDINPQDVNGVAIASATWFSIVAATGANATANFTTPVQAMRINVVTATATSSWTVNFVQAGVQVA